MSEQLPKLARRIPDGHKGSYGKVVIVGGSSGMSGAVALSGKAALRSGAGLVTVACPREIVPIVAGFEPSYLTLPLDQDAQGMLSPSAVEAVLARSWDVIGLGPGLGQSDGCRQVVAELLTRAEAPMVVDADGLNALTGRLELLERNHPTVITPHPGEFARLIGKSIAEVQQDRAGLAEHFAKEHGVVVVLKGHGTVISDGENTVLNDTGNPGMATGGTGDVLTGITVALIGQGLSAFDAARLAAHLHGDAGDLAAAELGQTCMIASDLLDFLPDAFSRYFAAISAQGAGEQE